MVYLEVLILMGDVSILKIYGNVIDLHIFEMACINYAQKLSVGVKHLGIRKPGHICNIHRGQLVIGGDFK